MGDAVAAALQADGVDVVFDADIDACVRSGAETIVRYASGDVAGSVRVAACARNRTRAECRGVRPRDCGRHRRRRKARRRSLSAHDQPAYFSSRRRHRPALPGAPGSLHRKTRRAKRVRRTSAGCHFDRFELHAVYTQPQIAVAGLTERECRARGIAVRIERHPFSDIGKALVSNEATGFIKMIAAGDGRIVGVAIVGNDAIDLIGEATAFIDRGATVGDVAAMPHLHPTMGEISAASRRSWRRKARATPAERRP